MQKITFLCLALIAITISSCKKSVESTTPVNTMCDRLAKVKITTAKTSYYVGDVIDLTVSDVVDGFYSWRHSVIPNDISTTEAVHIDYATKSYEGWFYLVIANPDCSLRNDSMYIEVINKPADAPCDPANNTTSFSSIPDISFSAATYGIDYTWNRKYIRGYQSFGYPDINVYFHPYWLDKEPEDGEYDMSSGGMAFGSSENVYEVFITSLYSSIFFQASGGKAYVKHVNGKLQVTFCDVPLSGSLGGPSYTTTASGKLTAP